MKTERPRKRQQAVLWTDPERTGKYQIGQGISWREAEEASVSVMLKGTQDNTLTMVKKLKLSGGEHAVKLALSYIPSYSANLCKVFFLNFI